MLTRRLPTGLTLAAAALLSGCATGPDFGAPEPTSSEGTEILSLYRGAMWVGIGVGALVWGLVAWSVNNEMGEARDLDIQAARLAAAV